MRRIRNITDEPLHVPLLGVTIQPGDVANVPATLDDVDFSEAYFDDESAPDAPDGPEVAPVGAVQSPTERPRRRPVDVVNIPATDSASTDEGAR